MPDTYKIEKLQDQFRDSGLFSQDELHIFYKRFDPELKRSTLRWRIYELKKRGVIKSVKRGWYSLDTKNEWKPELTNDLKHIFSILNEEFPYIEFCLWTTKWLRQYSHHMPTAYLTLIETEKDTEESVFRYLKNSLKAPVLLKPNAKEVTTYVDWNELNVFVKTLTSQSPLDEIDGIHIPKLEKIIVDLFLDHVALSAFKGGELRTIYKNLFEQYSINWSTLKRYASRRNKWSAFNDQLNKWNLNSYIIE